MKSWNQSTRRYAKNIKCKSLYNNSQGRWSVKSMVGRTTQDRTYSEIKLEIYSIMFLYFKEGQISMACTGLQKVELVHNKKQDTIIC